MFDKYLLSMELISINSKICFKLSVHRLVPIRRVLQIYAHIWNFNAERLDVNLVESIYGKVKKKQLWKKKNHVSGLFLESIFFLYKQNIQYRKLRQNILAFAILSLRKHWRVSPIYITCISPSYMMLLSLPCMRESRGQVCTTENLL